MEDDRRGGNYYGPGRKGRAENSKCRGCRGKGKCSSSRELGGRGVMAWVHMKNFHAGGESPLSQTKKEKFKFLRHRESKKGGQFRSRGTGAGSAEWRTGKRTMTAPARGGFK